MRIRPRHAYLAGAIVLVAGAAWWIVGPGPTGRDAAPANRPARMRPDWAGVVLPPNLAPLNFLLEEGPGPFEITIRAARGDPITLRGRTPAVVIPEGPWRRLLAANRGEALHVDACVRGADGRWLRFDTVSARIASEPIDGHLVYRWMHPLYNKYKHVGIYQRDLSNYDTSVVVRGRSFGHGCLNCHTFLNQRPDPMVLHIRSRHGLAMMLARGGKVAKVDTRTRFNASPAAYSSWHPGGRLIAFSVNKLSLFFHTVGENRDVFDAASDVGVYCVETNVVSTAPGLCREDRLETWPAWSADGRHLYFSSAPVLPKARYREVRYDLMRIPYDPEADSWEEPETVLSAADTGLSITEPRPSPDGRWLLVCMSEYGNFPIYQPSSDLYLIDLATGRYERLACNSDRCDSYHSWSSNSRWIVFSSKRMDGIFARPFFSYIDQGGKAHPPFPLPQKDPAYYDACIRTYNVPELVREPVPIGEREWARVIVDPAEGEAVQAHADPRAPERGGPAPPPYDPAAGGPGG